MPIGKKTYQVSLCGARGLCSGVMGGDSITELKGAFVDRVGWVTTFDILRYLQMGYRVWAPDSRRIHIHGDYTTYGFFLGPSQWMLCRQSREEPPDLLMQVSFGLFKDGSTEPYSSLVAIPEEFQLGRRVMPWELKPALRYRMRRELPGAEDLAAELMRGESFLGRFLGNHGGPDQEALDTIAASALACAKITPDYSRKPCLNYADHRGTLQVAGDADPPTSKTQIELLQRMAKRSDPQREPISLETVAESLLSLLQSAFQSDFRGEILGFGSESQPMEGTTSQADPRVPEAQETSDAGARGLVTSSSVSQGPDVNRGSPYPIIGVDQEYLSFFYPHSFVTLLVDGVEVPEPRDIPNKGLCDRCLQLDYGAEIQWSTSDVTVDIGTAKELFERTDCRFCRLLAIGCREALENSQRAKSTPSRVWSYQPTFFEPENLQLALHRSNQHIHNFHLHLQMQPTRGGYLWMGPVHSLYDTCAELRGISRLETKTSWDVETIKDLISECELEHGSACEVKSPLTDEHELILVDVSNKCLVKKRFSRSDQPLRYAALSYVWGSQTQFLTLKENLTELQKPGALDQQQLQSVVVDSMAVAAALKLQYLWVDTLCIVQDDHDNKMAQIRQMAEIYGSSWITIVALSGESSSAPLPGVSTRRPQLIEKVDVDPMTIQLSDLPTVMTGRTYEKRAWTYQERLMSRRCLYFTENQAYFECASGSVGEQIKYLPTTIDRIDVNELRDLVGGSDSDAAAPLDIRRLSYFSAIMAQYSSRRLTDPGDIANAFDGIRTVLKQRIGWRLLLGMPSGVLDWALLWLPWGLLNRRVRDPQTQIPRLIGPSWSWMAWEGEASYSEYVYHSRLLFRRVRPCVGQFVVRVEGGDAIAVPRCASEIWHPEVNEKLVAQWDGAYAQRALQDLDRLSEIDVASSPVLEFGGETVPFASLEKSAITWACTGEGYGMHTNGDLRHGYWKSINDYVSNAADPDGFELVRMATVDMYRGAKGMAGTEERNWQVEDATVVMLLEWKQKVAQRIAIGVLRRAEDWEKLPRSNKQIRLG